MTKINIRNYTSSVSAKQSINDIENILISLGASNIMQATMIRLEQVEFLEVFIPYAYDMGTKETFFERMKGNNFKQLSQ
jgi:hypothetical protein